MCGFCSLVTLMNSLVTSDCEAGRLSLYTAFPVSEMPAGTTVLAGVRTPNFGEEHMCFPLIGNILFPCKHKLDMEKVV